MYMQSSPYNRSWKHKERVDVKVYAFLALALDEVSVQRHVPAALIQNTSYIYIYFKFKKILSAIYSIKYQLLHQ